MNRSLVYPNIIGLFGAGGKRENRPRQFGLPPEGGMGRTGIEPVTSTVSK